MLSIVYQTGTLTEDYRGDSGNYKKIFFTFLNRIGVVSGKEESNNT